MDTASLFSGLDQQPYGTVTAPQEQAAADTGNESGPSGQTPGVPPMTSIINAIMRGAARVQGQEQAKGVAEKQAANIDKRQITFKPNPDDPGNPRVTLKDFTADALNGTEGSDIKEANDRPARQVEAKIAAGTQQQPTPAAAPQAQAPTTPPPADHPLEQAATLVDQSLGYRLARPWDPDIAEKLKSEDGIRQIAEEMGDKNPRATAHQAWRQIQHGKVSAQAVQQRVANFRLQKLEAEANRVETTMAPAERQAMHAQAAADRKQAEIDRQANQKRLLQNQSDTERKAVLSRKSDIIYKDHDWSLIPADQRHATFDAENDTGVPGTSYEYAKLDQKAAQDVNKAFLDYTDTKKDTFALGNQPSWEAAKTAFGHPLTPQQDTIGKARWQAARTYTLRKSQDEDMKRQHADDQHEMTMLRMQNATKEKPETLGRADVNLMDTSELLSIDPTTVKNYDRALEAKEGLLRKEIADHTDKRAKAAAQVKAIVTKPAERRQFGDEEQLAGFRADQQNANARVAAATAELQQIQAARAARRGGKTSGTVQPVTGAYQLEKSDTPDGRELIYYPPGQKPDASLRLPGSPPASATKPLNDPAPQPAHRPVANGQYAPQIENGIAAYMQAHGIGRSKAIQALRAAGKIH